MNAKVKIGLSHHDRIRVEELAEKGLKACTIAKAIDKPKSTVMWHLYSSGIQGPKQRDEAKVTHRNGKAMHWFTRDEDQLIQEMRQHGASTGEIAAKCNQHWNRDRTSASIRRRLMMLAGIEDPTP